MQLMLRLLVLVVKRMSVHVSMLALLWLLLLLLLQSRRGHCSHIGCPLPTVAAAHAAPKGDKDEGDKADRPHLPDV